MGRRRRPTTKKADSDSDSDEGLPLQSVVFLSSSDDEEANKDLSLEIVERAMKRESNRERAEVNGVISLSSASSEDMETKIEIEEKSKKNKKKSSGKRKKKNEFEAEGVEVVDAALQQEELVGAVDSVVTEVNEVSDNVVLRKLMRRSRYFDLGEKESGTCFNCGEEGHNANDCTMERRRKPCFVCGMFGHNAKRCTQGQNCFVCKKRGHIAKNCAEKHNHTTQDSNICLRCGDVGHDMVSCKNDYPPDDLKEMKCYVCEKYGHLCCADFADDGPREVSCYNCAQPGHTGLGCAKPRGEVPEAAKVCYKCGEEGHFVRGCTKILASKNKDGLEFGSVPRDFGKLRVNGGWIVDDHGEFRRKNHEGDNWKSPGKAGARESRRFYSSASSGAHFSSSRSPFEKHRSFLGTPDSNDSMGSHHHDGYYTPRYYG